MPLRHHRTVDRVTRIVEMVSRSPRGLTLTEITARLDAPKTSVHQLLNGLVATGYVIEIDRRFSLGPAPFLLTLTGNRVAAQEIDHDLFVRLQQQLHCSIAVGVQVGDTLIYVDHVGDDPALEFATRNYSRRQLYATASGKIVLANLPIKEMNELLLSAPHREEHNVEIFLRELPAIRQSGLAYNRSATVPGVYAVATAFCTPTGEFVGSVCALGSQELEPRLPQIGRSMQKFLADQRRLQGRANLAINPPAHIDRQPSGNGAGRQ